MKIKHTTILICLLVFSRIFAQNAPEDKRSQIKSLKVAYITTELDLTNDEAAKFWPVFNSFEDKQRAIRKENIRLFRFKLQPETLNSLSEKEATNLLFELENSDAALFELKKRFLANLKEILPTSKILKLKMAEDQFSRKLLQQYKAKK